jgi:hypothetical protein
MPVAAIPFFGGITTTATEFNMCTAQPETGIYRSLFFKEAVLDFCSVKNEKFLNRR